MTARLSPRAHPTLRDLPAIVLAGGRGSRLWPVTRDRLPKPLVRVGPRTLVEHTLAHLAAQGIQRIVLVIGHLADQVREFVGDGRHFGVSITYSTIPPSTIVDLLHTAVRDAGLTGEFLFCCADEVRDGLDLQRLYTFHRKAGALLTLATARLHDDRGAYAMVDVNADGTIARLWRRDAPPDGPHVAYLGLAMVDARFVPHLLALPTGSREPDLIGCARHLNGLRAFVADAVDYAHVATPDDLSRADRLLTAAAATATSR